MRYLCIHGHFYQPPRENAWTGEIELQESALPCHDWNERITHECYAPNAKSRVLNDKKEIEDLVNNYSQISFNFGPTLLSWLEVHNPKTYRAILDADALSQKNFSGHGAAIAQVYNHIIMPLANAADKETQVVWGIKDFEKRFQRAPEGMWLAETACNTETLEVLAKHGVKFTILAPGQCARVRPIGSKFWSETAGATVDPTQPYICNLPSGKSIVIFFYDGPISQGIAFSDTLRSGENFASRLAGAFTDKPGAQLVHIATDGETYGHHQKFADMALAYCLKHVKENKIAKITVYGEFLEKNPPLFEAQINENTSWSCFHGVERWRNDCGCNSGGNRGWHQKWRKPLREALDFVRDALVKNYETMGADFFHNPWAARNEYIKIILDPSEKSRHEFLLAHAKERAWNDRVSAFRLLEAQRNALLMYTSCGWFFDEISGIEGVQIMQYAARAIELNALLGFKNLEPEFIEKLEGAPSNIKDLLHGGAAYENFVKPSYFSHEKAVFNYAAALARGENPKRLLAQNISESNYEILGPEHGKMLTGSAIFENVFDTEKHKKHFLLFNVGNYRLTGFVFDKLPMAQEEIKNLLLEKGTDICLEEIKKSAAAVYTLSDLTKDAQKLVTDAIMTNIHNKTAELFDRTFDEQYGLLRGLKFIGKKLPAPFMFVAEFVFTEDIKMEICKNQMSPSRIEELFEDAAGMQAKINYAALENTAQKKLEMMCKAFESNPSRENAVSVVDFLKAAQSLPFKTSLFNSQENVFEGLRKLRPAEAEESVMKVLARIMSIAR